MSKNIVLLSDGTGNSAGSLFKTNVWRLYQLLDLSNPQGQVAFYDDGVGTSSFKLFAILGGIFGFGLKRNVIAIYSFCCRNYEPGDRIYCFGFSRGSFTIRIVTGMIALLGLVDYKNNEAELANFAADAYRQYRRRFNGGIPKYLARYCHVDLRNMRDVVIRWWRKLTHQPVAAGTPVEVESIHFVGIWDTVDAYGGPIQEMTRAIDYWIWPLSMPDQFMSAKVLKACHAMSLEDERDAFTPVIWDQRYVRAKAQVPNRHKTDWLFDIDYDPRSAAAKTAEPPPHLRAQLPAIDQQRISQVWFVGVHADVGGGYPQNGLAYVTLDWMLDRAEAYGLSYSPGQRAVVIAPQVSPDDKLNDSRKGLAAYYRYKPRNLKDLLSAPPYKPSFRDDVATIWRMLRREEDPQTKVRADLHPSVCQTPLPPPRATIHESVFNRIRYGTDRYVPIVMPKSYFFTDKAGAVTDALHPVDPGGLRSKVQNDVWNWIWLRRVVYFLTAFATAFVVATPVWVIYRPGFGNAEVGKLVTPVVNAAASFLPAFLEPWWVAFRNGPGFVLGGGVVALALMTWGAGLQQKIHDVARVAWHSPATHTPLAGWRAWIYQLRRLRIYPAFFYVLSRWILPTAIMFWLFWWLAFGTANTLGLICKATGNNISVTDTDIPAQKYPGHGEFFDTRELCYPTGLKVVQGERYQISLAVKQPWFDHHHAIPATPAGFGTSNLAEFLGTPFKRLIWSNWFAPIVRIGGPGLDEYLPAFSPDASDANLWKGEFVARSDGEVFVYVNDTSIFLPWLFTHFYENNEGTAVISLKKM
jgi:uncharacterized protein (DUF2235 family)